MQAGEERQGVDFVTDGIIAPDDGCPGQSQPVQIDRHHRLSRRNSLDNADLGAALAHGTPQRKLVLGEADGAGHGVRSVVLSATICGGKSGQSREGRWSVRSLGSLHSRWAPYV
jgi:hypothetical protein